MEILYNMNHKSLYKKGNIIPSHKKEERKDDSIQKRQSYFLDTWFSLQVLQLHYVTTEYSASEGQRIGFRKAPIH